MDSMGDGDELAFEDDLPPTQEPFLTPESYVSYAGPSGVLAAAGVILGWPVRSAETNPSVRGLAAAAVVVGALVTLGVIAGLITVTQLDDGQNL